MARASQGITWMERSRRWQLRLFEGGQLLYLRYFSVRAYGSKAAALYAAERDRAEQLTHHSRGDPLHPERVTVDQLLDQVIAAKQHWQSADELPGRVLQIRHHLGARSACEVSDADVSALQRLLLDYYAPKTVRHGMLLLRQALQRGVEQRLLLTNPACKVRLPTPPRRQGRFTPREVQLLLEAAGDTWLHPAICLMADCALRPGEVCALRWDDIHPQWRNLHVQRSRATLRATKTPRGDRVVPLTSRLRASLQTWRPLCRSCEWVFPALNGADLPLRVQTLDDHFGQLLVRAGVRPRRAYDLRRSAITLAVTHTARAASPGNLQDVAAWAGQLDILTTLRYYTDAIGDEVDMADVLEMAWDANAPNADSRPAAPRRTAPVS